jgi:hypothetical protein
MRTEGQISGVCMECADKEKCRSVCGKKQEEVLIQTKKLLELNNVTGPESLERLIDRVWDLDWKYNFASVDPRKSNSEWGSPEKFFPRKEKIGKRLREPNKSALDFLEFYYRTLRDYAARKMASEHDISTLRIGFGPYTKNKCSWEDYDMVYGDNDVRKVFRWVYEQVQDIYYFTNVDPHSWLYGKWVKGKKSPYDWRERNEYWCGERRRPDGTLVWEKSKGYLTI